MKDKIKKLLRGTECDQLIACNLLVNNYNVRRFLIEWLKTDNNVYEFISSEDLNRPGILFTENYLLKDGGGFYYQYSPRRYILCNSEQIVICYKPYVSSLEIIKHERKNT